MSQPTYAGAYNPATPYSAGQVTAIDASTNWIYIGTTPSVGNMPGQSPTFWQQFGATQVFGNYVQDASGNLLNNCTISFQPCTVPAGVSTSFKWGGARGGQAISAAMTTQVTNGAFGLLLADTSMTTPVNVGYLVTVIDNVSLKVVLGFGYTIQPSTYAWNLDTFDPNLKPNITVSAGPPGLSAYQVWLANGHTGSESDYETFNKGANGATNPNFQQKVEAAFGLATTTLETSGSVESAAVAPDAYPNAAWGIFDDETGAPGFIVNVDKSLDILGPIRVRGSISSTTPASASARTLILTETFATLPDGWYQSGGFATGSTGLTTPSSGQGWNCFARSLDYINCEERTSRFRLVFLSAGSIVAVGSILGNGFGTAGGTLFTVNLATKNIEAKNTNLNSGNDPGNIATQAIGFTVALNTEYLAMIEKDKHVLTFTLFDPLSGASVSVSNGDNTASGPNETTGEQHDVLAIFGVAGQTRIPGISLFCGQVKPRLMIWGDSITEGAFLTLTQRYAGQLQAAMHSPVVISARSGGTSVGALAKCTTELGTIRPEYLMLFIGTNDVGEAAAGTQAQSVYQSNINGILTAATAIGVQVIICLLPPRGDVAQSYVNAFNSFLLSLPGIVAFVRMDRALTVNHAGVTQDTTLFQPDTIHPNAAGALQQFNRFPIDTPFLFD